MKTSGTGFKLWLIGVFGLCGLHRFYLDRPVSGLVWLLTLGLFGVGQLVDLFLLRRMVREDNHANTNTIAIDPRTRQMANAIPSL